MGVVGVSRREDRPKTAGSEEGGPSRGMGVGRKTTKSGTERLKQDTLGPTHGF